MPEFDFSHQPIVQIIVGLAMSGVVFYTMLKGKKDSGDGGPINKADLLQLKADIETKIDTKFNPLFEELHKADMRLMLLEERGRRLHHDHGDPR